MAPHLEGADSALVLLFRSTHRPPVVSPATHYGGPRCLALSEVGGRSPGTSRHMQAAVGEAVSDADAVRGDVRGYLLTRSATRTGR
jgi:hypothetical protein